MDFKDFKFRAATALAEEDFKDLYDEMTKPMGVEEIEDFLHHASWQSKKGLAKIIQPITRQQGFVVDRQFTADEFRAWARGKPYNCDTDQYKFAEEFAKTLLVPPTPKYREISREEKIQKLKESGWIDGTIASSNVKDSTIDDLCAAAGIPTKIEVKE